MATPDFSRIDELRRAAREAKRSSGAPRIKGGAPSVQPPHDVDWFQFERIFGIPFSCKVKDAIERERVLMPWAWYLYRHGVMRDRLRGAKLDLWLLESMRELKRRYGLDYASTEELLLELEDLIARRAGELRDLCIAFDLMRPTRAR
jgi:hypothetical protein